MVKKEAPFCFASSIKKLSHMFPAALLHGPCSLNTFATQEQLLLEHIAVWPARLLTTTLLFKEQTPPLTWADGEMSSLVLRGALTNILTWALNRAEVCRATYALWHKFFYAWALLSTMSAGICMMLHAVFVSWSLTMQQGPGSSREWKIRALFI